MSENKTKSGRRSVTTAYIITKNVKRKQKVITLNRFTHKDLYFCKFFPQ